jgi:LysM repeat protein
MANGVDYSWARPGAKAIHDGGYTFAARYLSYDTSGKNISSEEASDLLNNGVSIVLVWEQAANDALQGHDKGVAEATDALAQARAIGFPEDRPIYFAVDFDEADTDQQNNALYDYFRGVVEVIGFNRVGIYAGYYPVKRVHEQGLAKWLWQTLAWSGGQVYDGIHIYQNGASAFGNGADVDEARQSDIGAWGAGSSVNPAPPVPAPVQPVPSPAPSSSAGGGGTYTVVSGDNLSAIGTKTGSDWRAIAQLNGIGAPYVIYPNEVLNIPGGNSPAPDAPAATTRYTVKSGDTLGGIGQKFGVDYHTIAAANGIADPDKIYPGQVLVIPGSNSPAPNPTPGRTYTVASGDNLSAIGASQGVDWHAIASINGIGDPYTIYPGQVLKLS